MKIVFRTAGGRREFNPNQVRDLGNAIAQNIYDAIGDRTMGISQFRLNKLVKAIEAEVAKETAGIFDKAVSIINKTKSRTVKHLHSPYMSHRELTAFRASDLGTGSAVTLGNAMAPSGSVNWEDLSQRWVRYKRRHRPGTEQKFFVFKGGLYRYLNNGANNSKLINRMGGVQAHADGINELEKRKLTRGNAEFAMARLTIDVFPSIPAAMLPMMSSQRWNTDSDGAFERRFIGGKTGRKLAGTPTTHRPLVQPIVQFWMAYRIPVAIQRAVTRTLKVRNG